MSIKHLLVFLDDSPQCRARVEYAVGLANRHQALLSGASAARGGAFQTDQTGVRDLFLSLSEAGKVRSQWLDAGALGSGADPLDGLVAAARFADLVIVGQRGPTGDTTVPRDLPEKLVLLCGRPVLVLPYAGVFDPRCERTLIAWSGGRESVRALHDGLPLLQQSRRVILLNLSDTGDAPEVEESLHLLCQHLAEHGIQAHAEIQYSHEVSKGDLLLNRCADIKADLLVAGGYRQGRLGDVARHLLKYMTVPILMSH